jgi:hypothetical protein
MPLDDAGGIQLKNPLYATTLGTAVANTGPIALFGSMAFATLEAHHPLPWNWTVEHTWASR